MRNAIWVALRNHRPRAAAAIAQDLLLMAFCAARSGHLARRHLREQLI